MIKFLAKIVQKSIRLLSIYLILFFGFLSINGCKKENDKEPLPSWEKLPQFPYITGPYQGAEFKNNINGEKFSLPNQYLFKLNEEENVWQEVVSFPNSTLNLFTVLYNSPDGSLYAFRTSRSPEKTIIYQLNDSENPIEIAELDDFFSSSNLKMNTEGDVYVFDFNSNTKNHTYFDNTSKTVFDIDASILQATISTSQIFSVGNKFYIGENSKLYHVNKATKKLELFEMDYSNFGYGSFNFSAHTYIQSSETFIALTWNNKILEWNPNDSIPKSYPYNPPKYQDKIWFVQSDDGILVKARDANTICPSFKFYTLSRNGGNTYSFSELTDDYPGCPEPGFNFYQNGILYATYQASQGVMFGAKIKLK